MKLFVLFLVLFVSIEGHAFLGAFNGNSCPYNPQQSQPPQSDYNHAARMQARELEQRRLQLDGQLNQLNQEIYRVQNGVRRYFRTPWSEAILSHMDNGFDCCAAGRAVGLNTADSSRMPAGDPDYVPPHHQQDDEVVATPQAPEPQPLPGRPIRPTPIPDPVPPQRTCQGYEPSYCNQDDWGHDQPDYAQGGQQCLQSGFASLPAWNFACQPGGQINPRVCSDPRISTSPHEAQACYQMLQVYQQLARRKRLLANEVNHLNSQIQILAQPNRPYSPSYYGGSESQYGGESSEVTSNNGLWSALGAVLGGAASAFVNNQMYQPQPYYRPMPGPVPSRPIIGGPMPGRLPGQIVGTRPIGPSPVPYYGPSHGYPYSNGGVYGRIVPGTTGAHGCSTGLNSGFSVIGQLLANAFLKNKNNGPFSGYPAYAQYNSLYGNRLPGQPVQSFRGTPPPYRPGGLYGGVGPAGPGSVITPRQYISVPTNYAPGYNGSWNYNRPMSNFAPVNSNPQFFNNQYVYQPQPMYRPQPLPSVLPGRIMNYNNSGYVPQYSAAPQIYRPNYYSHQPSNGGLSGVLSSLFGGGGNSGSLFVNVDF